MPAYTLISYYHDRPDGSALHFDAANDAAARIEATHKIRERGEKPAPDSKWELLSDEAGDASLGFYADDGAPMVGARIHRSELLDQLTAECPAWDWEVNPNNASGILGRCSYGGGSEVCIDIEADPLVLRVDWEHNAGRDDSMTIPEPPSESYAASVIAEFLAELA